MYILDAQIFVEAGPGSLNTVSAVLPSAEWRRRGQSCHAVDRDVACVQRFGDAMGFLYVDGHVRAYHGKRELPKTHVARVVSDALTAPPAAAAARAAGGSAVENSRGVGQRGFGPASGAAPG